MKSFKSAVKAKIPWLVPVVRTIKVHALRYRSSGPVFERIYLNNEWGDTESVSGPGSSILQTTEIRESLPKMVDKIAARSMLDIPCGDFWWMKELDLSLDEYIGADVIEELVRRNNQRFATPSRRFECIDLVTDPLPTVDLIFCRDLLVHLTNRDVLRSLSNIVRSKSTFLLMTTFPSLKKNIDILSGEWRAINFQIGPFHLPEPISLLGDSGNSRNLGKALGLWRVSEI